MYNLYNTEAQFKNFLIAGNISQVSIRNYLSDMRHFYGWFMANHSSNDFIEELNGDKNYFANYNSYLYSSTTSDKTVKRRLSTLRKLCECLVEQHLLSNVPDIKSEHSTTSVAFKTAASLDISTLLSHFRYDELMNNPAADVETEIKHVEDFLNQIVLE